MRELKNRQDHILRQGQLKRLGIEKTDDFIEPKPTDDSARKLLNLFVEVNCIRLAGTQGISQQDEAASYTMTSPFLFASRAKCGYL